MMNVFSMKYDDYDDGDDVSMMMMVSSVMLTIVLLVLWQEIGDHFDGRHDHQYYCKE